MFMRLSAVAIFLSTTSLPVAAHADSTTAQLVYHFTYSADQNITARDASDNAESYGAVTGGSATYAKNGGPGTAITNPSSNGMSHYDGRLTDKGTMTVDVLQRHPDGTVDVAISEQGENVRRAPPAKCSVYGNTYVFCDPTKTVYTEEYTLLRFLAGNFVAPGQLQTSNHWSVVQSSSRDMTVHAEYTINSANGGAMQIGERRTVKQSGSGSLTTNVEAQIGYDTSRSLPTSVAEYATQYTDAGVNGTSKTTYQTTLNLVSDTMAKN
jgi:hypothetical protein